ncbi:MAG: beta-mannosidase [Ruminococcus sp.]|nr:beta-mannosidase [Ruminococcus sp.]
MFAKTKKVISFISAAAIVLSITGCNKSDSSSNDESSRAETTRANITTAPVVETLGDFDLSDVVIENKAPADYKKTIEAEDGKLSGDAISTDKNFLGDFTGKGFISLFHDTDKIDLDIEIPEDGSYDVNLVSAADQAGSSCQISIDGAALVTSKINSTELSDNVAEKVLLTKGKHTITLNPKDDMKGIYIDSITFTTAKAVDLEQYKVSNELSNPNATEETQRLYNFLTNVYGKYTISGQYASNSEGKDSREFVQLKKELGATPAILGLDLIEASPSRIANGSSESSGQIIAAQAMDWWNNEGGIVTMCWHWNAPEPYLNANGHAWWEGFNQEATSFSLAKALNGEDKEGYDYLIRDIDAIAEVLIQLDDNHVPILWRPLHEGGGDPQWNNPWFWWGASGADAYKELWKLMYDRLTNYHHINNLIWVWNGQNPQYYPGDEYVDILGYDIYANEHDSSSQKDKYDYTQATTETNKIVALSENGVLFDPDIAFNDGARWAWFCTWNGEFTLKDMQLSDEYTTLDMWKKVYSSERVLTLEELPDLKNYPLDTEKFLAENK